MKDDVGNDELKELIDTKLVFRKLTEKDAQLVASVIVEVLTGRGVPPLTPRVTDIAGVLKVGIAMLMARHESDPDDPELLTSTVATIMAACGWWIAVVNKSIGIEPTKGH